MVQHCGFVVSAVVVKQRSRALVEFGATSSQLALQKVAENAPSSPNGPATRRRFRVRRKGSGGAGWPAGVVARAVVGCGAAGAAGGGESVSKAPRQTAPVPREMRMEGGCSARRPRAWQRSEWRPSCAVSAWSISHL